MAERKRSKEASPCRLWPAKLFSRATSWGVFSRARRRLGHWVPNLDSQTMRGRDDHQTGELINWQIVPCSLGTELGGEDGLELLAAVGLGRWLAHIDILCRLCLLASTLPHTHICCVRPFESHSFHRSMQSKLQRAAGGIQAPKVTSTCLRRCVVARSAGTVQQVRKSSFIMKDECFLIRGVASRWIRMECRSGGGPQRASIASRECTYPSDVILGCHSN